MKRGRPKLPERYSQYGFQLHKRHIKWLKIHEKGMSAALRELIDKQIKRANAKS